MARVRVTHVDVSNYLVNAGYRPATGNPTKFLAYFSLVPRSELLPLSNEKKMENSCEIGITVSKLSQNWRYIRG